MNQTKINVIDYDGNEGIININTESNEDMFTNIVDVEESLDSQNPFRSHRINLDKLAQTLEVCDN